jgi:preprotein translocase subunit SecA
MACQRYFGLVLKEDELRGMAASQITELISTSVKKIYDQQKLEIGEFFEQLIRMLMLQTIDQRWKEHLERIDRLKEGIHLRAHAQKDPLIEYKKEAFNAFQEMNMWIQEETVEKLLKIRLVNQERAREVLENREELDETELSYAGAEESPQAFSGPARPPQGLAPMAQRPPPQQQFMYGPGPGDDDGPKLNREQRRMQKKNKPKRRI